MTPQTPSTTAAGRPAGSPAAPEQPQSARETGAADDVRTVAFVSLGCPKNLVDSEKMLGLLAEDGLAIVARDPDADPDERETADAIIVNTCGFLEASKDESLGVIRQAIEDKAAGRLKRVVVAGCLVQRHRAKMLEWAPGIDAMIGVFDRDHIVEAVRGVKRERQTLDEASDKPKYWIAGNALQAARERGVDTVGLTVHGKDGKGVGYFEDDSARLRITPRHYAYLRMSEGCNQRCAFCTIPSIRGKMRSKPVDRIRTEAAELVRDGVFEIGLIGQDTTSYGMDIGRGLDDAGGWADGLGSGLPAVLRAASKAFSDAGTAKGWVRLMYAYPSNFDDRIIEAMAELSILNGGRLVPYIDIPLQHASDRVLTAMRRHVSAAHQADLMHRLRERVPGIAIRSTFITGFPGETEEDHEQLLEFIEDVGFDHMGVFEYSREEGTVAGTMEADPDLAVPEEVKARRKHELMSLQQRLAFEQNEFLADQFDDTNPTDSGVRLDVLIDRRSRTEGVETPGVSAAAGLYEGRTYFQAPQIDSVTYVHSAQKLAPGELVPCVIVGSDGYDLIARPVEDLVRKVALPILR